MLTNSTMTKKLLEISEEIRKCKKCDLALTRKNAVPGEGYKNARIMIIGQAPGKEEDLCGKPFVGRAGKFLENALKKFNKKREDFFITSIIKCYPPKNRKPKQHEINTCLPYTIKQIETIKPKAILLLGETSTAIFNKLFNKLFKKLFKKPYKYLNKNKFTLLRGKFIKKDSITYFTTFHPSAAMRFPKIRKRFYSDLKKFFSKIEKKV